jgi:hypothetical protein
VETVKAEQELPARVFQRCLAEGRRNTREGGFLSLYHSTLSLARWQIFLWVDTMLKSRLATIATSHPPPSTAVSGYSRGSYQR